MPARKPIEAKRRAGRSPGRDAGGRTLPTPIVVLPAAPTVPEPPAALKEAGQREWGRLWRQIPWLSPQSDIRLSTRLCQLTDRHAAMLAQIDQDGYIVDSCKGQPPTPS